jgi:hypothetical protein
VNGSPAIVTIAVRSPLPWKLATVTRTLPSSVPLAPLVIVIHDTGEVAVQLQPAVVVTSTSL